MKKFILYLPQVNLNSLMRLVISGNMVLVQSWLSVFPLYYPNLLWSHIMNSTRKFKQMHCQP